MEPSDVTPAIIQLAQQGDPTATSTLYQAYVGMIYRYVSYRVGNPHDAEDLTAEVFVRMVEALGRYKDKGAPFEAWLYRIAAARVADFHRKHSRRTHVELIENVISDEVQPEDRLMDQEEGADLREAIHHLSDEEQTILYMRFVERKSHQEVADILEKTVSAVKSNQHRALVKLANLLGEEKTRHYLRGRND